MSVDFAKLLKLPPYAQRPKPLPPGVYDGTIEHNDAGYFIRLRDGRCIPITLPVRTPS